MTLNIRTVVLAVLVLCGVVGGGYLLSSKNTDSQSDLSAEFAEDVHYRTLQAPVVFQSADNATDKVTVQEFFWYGCPHCQAFEPRVKKWLQAAPADIHFQQLPVAWNELTRLHAAVYYAAEEADNPEVLHEKLFERIIEIRQERNIASQIEQIAEVFAGHGIDSAELDRKLKSPAAETKIDTIVKMMKDAEVASTPTVVVDGRWVVLNNEAVAKAGVFNVIDFLVQKGRGK